MKTLVAMLIIVLTGTAFSQQKKNEQFNNLPLVELKNPQLAQFTNLQAFTDSSNRLTVFKLKIATDGNRLLFFEQKTPYENFTAVLFENGGLTQEQVAYIVNQIALWESEKKVKK
jgi:hypothetical protein